MFIKFTDQELKHIEGIKNEYSPKLLELQAKIDEQKGEERLTLTHERSILSIEYRERLEKYLDDIQRERFKAIKDQGTDAILDHAKEQAPLILEQIHKDTVQYYGYLKPQALKDAKIGTYKRGKLYVNANMATDWLKDELRLHAEALQGNKAAIQDLLEIIIEAVENSPYTDNQEIIDQAKQPVNITRYRRNPLTDITVFGLMNDKASAQLLQEGDIFQQQTDGQLTIRWPINQAPKGQKQVPVYIALTYEGTEKRIAKKLTAFDKAVYDAVGTRFYYWQQDAPQTPLYITPQEIWRTMNGKRSGDGRAKPSTTQVKKICDSLDKMRFTHFYMDLSEEIKAFDLRIDDDRIIGGHIDSYLLNSSKVEFITDKGNTVTGYRIGEEPILYTYNKVKNHLLYVPYEMLDTSTNTSDSENVTEFRTYLLQQIQLMKNAAEEGKTGRYFKRNSIILLETIYRDTGILTPEERIKSKEYKNDASMKKEIRRFRKEDRDKIEGILTAWKAKGWIKDYTVLNQNNEPIREKQQAKGYDISI